VEVFESAPEAGGRVETIHRDGYLVDTGATAIAARYPIFLSLAEEMGLTVVPASPSLGIRRDGTIHQLRLDKLVMAGVSTHLLSWPTKLRLFRLVADVVSNKLRGRLQYDDLRRAAPLDTETASEYVTRLAGREADEYLAEPMTRALLLGNSDRIGRVELMSGLVNAIAGNLTSLAGGQATIVEALAKRLPQIRTQTTVESVTTTASGVELVAADAEGKAVTGTYDGCVVAVPLPVAAAVARDHQPALARLGSELQYSAGINVALGFSRPPKTDCFLVLLPRKEDSEICMLIIESNKAADRAPAGHGLITVCWEMGAAADWIDRSDEEIIERSLKTVERVLPELSETLDMTFVRRWPICLPRTKPGVYRAIGDFCAAIDPTAPIQFAGDWLSQTGQNTAVAWGQRAAANLVAHGPAA
jgi:oxygen-dependent protoporphyrinogen oxidase